MGPKLFKFLFLLFVGIFSFLSASPLSFAALITDVRSWSAPDQIRVVLDLTEPVQYESFSQETPPQCHVEIKGAILFTKKREVEVNEPFLSKINLTDLGGGIEKGFMRTKVNVEVVPDTNLKNALVMVVKIDKGEKTKIRDISFERVTFNSNLLSFIAP